MRTRLFFAGLLLPMFSIAQENNTPTTKEKDPESGKIQVGVRTVVSAFSDSKYSGFGLGGQFRIKFGSRLNSEWFADYITTNIEDYADRVDYHIGWAVQYYPFNKEVVKGKFTPYIEAGNCFDKTLVTLNPSSSLTYYSPVMSLSRNSTAIHLGMGTCYNLSDNFDISLAAMYMVHLGQDIHTEVVKGPTDIPTVQLYKSNATLEGHLLINLSLNVYLGKLWGRK